MYFFKHEILRKSLTVLIIVSFLLSNNLYALERQSFLAVDSQQAFSRALQLAEVLQTPLAIHKLQDEMGINDLGALVRKRREMDEILWDLVSAGKLPGLTVNTLPYLHSLIVPELDPQSGEKVRNGGQAFYTFNSMGYFVRIRTRDFVDPFYAAFLQGRGAPLQKTIELEGKLIDVFRVTEENLPAINRTLKGLAEASGVAARVSKATIAGSGEEEKPVAADPVGTKGEHVGVSFLVDRIAEYDVQDIHDADPVYLQRITEIIDHLPGTGHREIAQALKDAVSSGKMKIVESPEGKDLLYLYLSCVRKMRYNVIAHIEDEIYVPKGLLDLFINPAKCREELKGYLGEEKFAKMFGPQVSGDRIRSWLLRALAGGFTHEGHEVMMWKREKDNYQRSTHHNTANMLERNVAGVSVFDAESHFDDITKFLFLRDLGMKPEIFIFDILRDRLRSNEGIINHGYGFERHNLRDVEGNLVRHRLERLLETEYDQAAIAESGDYHLITYKGRAIAFSKSTAEGELIYSLYPDETKIDHYPVKNLIADYRDLATATYKPQVMEYHDRDAEDRTLAGTKCAKLAWAFNKGIPNPVGFNITKYGNLAYLRHNPDLLEALQGIKELNVMNVRQRKDFSERVQELMHSETELPEELLERMQDLITEYSRRLGYDVDKGEYASFAYRGSGLMEDFEGTIPWFQKSIGAQPGQGTTVLHKRGLDVVAEATIEAIAGLFNDQIFIYRDIQVFFDFVIKMTREKGGDGEREYRKLIEILEQEGFAEIARSLTEENSPGYVRLRDALARIEEKRPDIKDRYHWLDKLNESADEILNPVKLLTGVAVLEQLDSYVSGTAFTSNLGRARDGSTFAKCQGNFPEKPGDDFGGFTRYQKVNVGPGMGPGIVEGKFEPDIFSLFSPDGENWVYEDFMVGGKEMRLVYLEYAYQALKEKLTFVQIKALVEAYGRYRNAPDKSRRRRRARGELAQLLKIDDGLVDDWVRAMFDDWYYFGKPEQQECPAEVKRELLRVMNLTKEEFFILAHIIKHEHKIDTDYDTLSYLPNPANICGMKILSPEAIMALAKMIAEVGNLNAQEACEEKYPGDWIDRRDIEFAFAVCQPDDESPYKFRIAAGKGFDMISGRPNEEEIWIKLCHLQNRPINPEKEAQDPDNLVFEKRKVDKKYVEDKSISPIADGGLAGFSAAEGVAYIVSPERDLAIQEEEIRAMVAAGESVIPVLEEMGPEHDVIVAAAGKAVVWRGNDTSHAYIFSLEQRIPICIGAKMKEGQPAIVRGQPLVIDGENGVVYPGDQGIPIIADNITIRIDMMPETRAGSIVADDASAEEVAKLGGKISSVLTRLEFVINQKIKIYPQAALAYDNWRGLNAGVINVGELTAEELRDVDILQERTDVIYEITMTIAGFGSATEFVTEKMRYLANKFGAIFPLGNKMRDYDNKEKEALMYGLIGAGLFLRYDDTDPRFDSPLVGMRGSALMADRHFEKCFRPLRRGIIRSIKDGFRNNSFFFVFLRTPEELRSQLEDLEKLCQEEGVYPEELGVMIEVPSAVWQIEEFFDLFDEFKARNPQIKELFISFGTNDLAHLLAMNSREDKDFTDQLLVEDPVLLTEPRGRIMIEEGVEFGPEEEGQPWRLQIDDESATAVLRSIEHVSAVAKRRGYKRSLCGQAITLALNKGNTAVARRLMSALDSFGTQTTNAVAAAMLDFDARSALRDVSVDGDPQVVAEFTQVSEEGALTGELVFINENSDLVKLRQGEIKDKIVVINAALAAREDFEQELIPWDYLRYARAILINEDLADPGAIFTEDAVIGGRIKGKIKLLAGAREGELVTVDYRNGRVYQGELELVETLVNLEEISSAEAEDVKTEIIVEHNAADIFYGEEAKVGIHPLAFVLYAEGKLDNGEFKKQLEELVEGKTEEELSRFQEEVLGSLTVDEFVEYLKSLVVESLQPFEDVDQYLEFLFYQQLEKEAQAAGDNIAVHTTFRLTRNHLRVLLGGEIIEMTKGKEGVHFDDPLYRLMGGARNISDFWRIHRAELRAFARAREEHDNLRLQLTAMGTRAEEVLELQLRVLEEEGINRVQEKIGLRLTTPADILYVADYIRQGIAFFTFNRDELAEGLLAANLNHPDLFADTQVEQVELALTRPLAYVRRAIGETDPDVWLAELPRSLPARPRLALPDEDSFAHLLPLYLHRAFRQALVESDLLPDWTESTVDKRITRLAYTTRRGNIHVAEGRANSIAAKIMADTLSAILTEKARQAGTIAGDKKIIKTYNDVIEILEVHENVHRKIKKREEDFQVLRDQLIARLETVDDNWVTTAGLEGILGLNNSVEDKLNNLLCSFARNYGYLYNYPQYKNIASKNYRLPLRLQLKLLEELAVHQVIEFRHFKQSVSLLPLNFTDADKNRVGMASGMEDIIELINKYMFETRALPMDTVAFISYTFDEEYLTARERRINGKNLTVRKDTVDIRTLQPTHPVEYPSYRAKVRIREISEGRMSPLYIWEENGVKYILNGHGRSAVALRLGAYHQPAIIVRPTGPVDYNPVEGMRETMRQDGNLTLRDLRVVMPDKDEVEDPGNFVRQSIADLKYPAQLAADSQGRIYCLDAQTGLHVLQTDSGDAHYRVKNINYLTARLKKELPGENNQAKQLAVDSKGDLYLLIDSWVPKQPFGMDIKQCICVLSPDLALKSVIVEPVTGISGLKEIDSQGNIYLTTHAGEVTVIDSNGKLLNVIEQREMRDPAQVRIADNGLIYVLAKRVTGRRPAIFVFDQNGQLIRDFEVPLSNPAYLALTDKGESLLVGNNRGRIIFLDKEGSLSAESGISTGIEVMSGMSLTAAGDIIAGAFRGNRIYRFSRLTPPTVRAAGEIAWEAELENSGQLINATEQNEDVSVLQRILQAIKKKQGAGIFAGVDKIRVVNALDESMSVVIEEGDEKILLIDNAVFIDGDMLQAAVAHGLRISILRTVVWEDKFLQELTAIFMTVKEVLAGGLSGFGPGETLPAAYRFLEIVDFLSVDEEAQASEIEDKDIIAAAIELMMIVPSYRKIFSESGGWRHLMSDWKPRRTWRRDGLMRKTRGELAAVTVRYRTALKVFDMIAEAGGIVNQVRNEEVKTRIAGAKEELTEVGLERFSVADYVRRTDLKRLREAEGESPVLISLAEAVDRLLLGREEQAEEDRENTTDHQQIFLKPGVPGYSEKNPEMQGQGPLSCKIRISSMPAGSLQLQLPEIYWQQAENIFELSLAEQQQVKKGLEMTLHCFDPAGDKVPAILTELKNRLRKKEEIRHYFVSAAQTLAGNHKADGAAWTNYSAIKHLLSKLTMPQEKKMLLLGFILASGLIHEVFGHEAGIVAAEVEQQFPRAGKETKTKLVEQRLTEIDLRLTAAVFRQLLLTEGEIDEYLRALNNLAEGQYVEGLSKLIVAKRLIQSKRLRFFAAKGKQLNPDLVDILDNFALFVAQPYQEGSPEEFRRRISKFCKQAMSAEFMDAFHEGKRIVIYDESIGEAEARRLYGQREEVDRSAQEVQDNPEEAGKLLAAGRIIEISDRPRQLSDQETVFLSKEKAYGPLFVTTQDKDEEYEEEFRLPDKATDLFGGQSQQAAASTLKDTVDYLSNKDLIRLEGCLAPGQQVTVYISRSDPKAEIYAYLFRQQFSWQHVDTSKPSFTVFFAPELTNEAGNYIFPQQGMAFCLGIDSYGALLEICGASIPKEMNTGYAGLILNHDYTVNREYGLFHLPGINVMEEEEDSQDSGVLRQLGDRHDYVDEEGMLIHTATLAFANLDDFSPQCENLTDTKLAALKERARPYCRQLMSECFITKVRQGQLVILTNQLDIGGTPEIKANYIDKGKCEFLTAAYIQDHEDEVREILSEGRIIIVDNGAELKERVLLTPQQAYGGIMVPSARKSRAKEQTVHLPQAETFEDPAQYTDYQQAMVSQADGRIKNFLEYIKTKDLIMIEGTLGGIFPIRLYISKADPRAARFAYFFRSQFREPLEKGAKALTLVFAPEYETDKPAKYMFLEQGIGLCWGMDYAGEIKKGFLTMGNYRARKKGWLGLHAGLRKTCIRHKHSGEERNLVQVFFGLSGSGKTTYSTSNVRLGESLQFGGVLFDEPGMEQWEVVSSQTGLINDDMLYLVTADTEVEDQSFKAGEVIGTETNVFAIISDLTRSEHEQIHEATFNNYFAFLENVDYEVGPDGLVTVNVQSGMPSRNMRATILRDAVNRHSPMSLPLSTPGFAKDTKLQFVFLSPLINNAIRAENPAMDAVPLQKLTPQQAVLALIAGVSVETPASSIDPQSWGKAAFSQFFGKPFLHGDPQGYAADFYRFLQENADNISAWMLNTRAGQTIDEEGAFASQHRVTIRQCEDNLLAVALEALGLLKLKYQGHPILHTQIPAVPRSDLGNLVTGEFSPELPAERMKEFRGRVLRYARDNFPQLPTEIMQSMGDEPFHMETVPLTAKAESYSRELKRGDKTGVGAISEHVRKYSTNKMLTGNTGIIIDNDIREEMGLEFTEIVALITAALSEAEQWPEADRANLSAELIISLLTGSPHLAENCKRDGFIGLNSATFRIYRQLREALGVELANAFIQWQLEHELIHELCPESVQADISAFEAQLAERDKQRFIEIFGEQADEVINTLLHNGVSNQEFFDEVHEDLQLPYDCQDYDTAKQIKITLKKQFQLETLSKKQLAEIIGRTRRLGLPRSYSEVIRVARNKGISPQVYAQVFLALEEPLIVLLGSETHAYAEKIAKVLAYEIYQALPFFARVQLEVSSSPRGIRFQWARDDVKRAVRNRVEKTVRQMEKFTLPQPPAEEADVKKETYVLIDQHRANQYGETIAKVADAWGVRFVTEEQLPADVRREDVVVLLDPSDADYDIWGQEGYQWYLPLVYCEQSFFLAAWLTLNKPADLRETPVFDFMKGYYESILGEEIADEEILSWLTSPWRLNQRIRPLTEEISFIRIALTEIAKSA